MGFFVALDASIFAWINTGWSHPALDRAAPWISRLADPGIVWVWIALLCCMAGWATARASRGQGKGHAFVIKAVLFAGMYLALIYVANAGAYKVLKYIIHRPRPFMEQAVVLRIPLSLAAKLSCNGSFPSGHAANAFMLAALFAAWARRARFAFYGLAALVAWSRIYLGVHYPGDVAAGACLGLAVTRLMLTYPPQGYRAVLKECLPSKTRPGPPRTDNDKK